MSANEQDNRFEQQAETPGFELVGKVEEPKQDRGQLLLVVLIALAFIASVVMLFSNSDAAMKIAVLAALWAAAIGLFLVTRYRRIADEQRRSFEAELRETKLQMEKEVAQRSKVMPAASEETLQDIRDQLTALREQLEELSGREFGYEPAALRAEARRIQEIESTFPSIPEPVEVVEPEILSKPSSLFAGIQNPLIEDAKTEPVEVKEAKEDKADKPVRGADRFDTGSFAAVKWDVGGVAKDKQQGPSDAETAIIPQVVEDPKLDASKSNASKSDEPKLGSTNKGQDSATGKAAKDVSSKDDSAKDAAAKDAAEKDKADSTESEAEVAPAQEQPKQERGGRRRRDEHEDGLSVAELLANLKKEGKK